MKRLTLADAVALSIVAAVLGASIGVLGLGLIYLLGGPLWR